MEFKLLLTFLVTFFSFNISVAQQITYHDRRGNEVSEDKAFFYRETRKIGKGLWKINEYYRDGSAAASGSSSKKNGSVREGQWIWYFQNKDGIKIEAIDSSQIKMVCFYNNNKKDGEEIQYYEPGLLREKSIFNKGVEISTVKYYKNGTIESKSEFEDKKPIARQDFFENGQLKNDIKFKHDDENISMLVKSYYENGNLMRDSRYDSPNRLDEYKFISGKCYDESGKKIPEILFTRSASFPGGSDVLKEYIRITIRYPREAAKEGAQGKVYVSYTIDKEGNVTKPRIARSVNKYIDEEALRLVRNMPKYLPEIKYGELVNKKYTIPINFSLQ